MLAQGKTFMSGNFFLCYNNTRSAFLALAVMNLPFTPVKHEFQSKNRGMIISVTSDMILFQKEVNEATVALNNEIIVNHRYTSVGGVET
mmetsp:Transcript_22201/g.16601  ORF Transcript_22201/g.16601 Transcript_22201/m.16601 type:complete len:89 (+) Transcript_22201:1731-1997(+)